MGSRAAQIVAEVWRLSRGGRARDEAVLVAALAAVLEQPEVWPRLVQHLGWKAFPHMTPRVSTQDRVPDGRTDITLTWPTGRRLVLELKVWGPPGPEQIKTYLEAGVDVAAVAAIYASVAVEEAPGSRFLGVVTWRQIRALAEAWPDAPLALHQLAALLDTMGVAMPKLGLNALQGVVASWDAWSALEEWIHKATEGVEQTLTKAGLPCVRKDEPRHQVKVDDQQQHRRLVGWTWPPRWRAEEQFGFYVGLRMGSPEVPLQVEGVPDLILSLHVNPASPLGAALRADAALGDAVKLWRQRTTPPAVLREWHPSATVWSLLRARASAVEILYAEDQGERLASWMTARAQEWVEDGVVTRLAELRSSHEGH